MQLASTIIGALGDVLVLITVIVAVRALRTATGARTDAQASEDAAVQARKEAADREVTALNQAAEAAKVADERAEAAARRDSDAAWRTLALDEISRMERQRDRVGRIGQLVEDLFWRIEASDEPLERAEWLPLRNNLRHQLVGLHKALPICARILDAGTSTQAFGDCVAARVEVEGELTSIDSALHRARSSLLGTLEE